MSEMISREDILGDAHKTFTFDKVLRGYDTKQVDDYINNLVKSNKNAIEIINSRISEMKTENEMLRFELEQTQKELKAALDSGNGKTVAANADAANESSKNEEKIYLDVANIYESAVKKAEDMISSLKNELSLARSKAEDAKSKE